jgi:hypothetical protein
MSILLAGCENDTDEGDTFTFLAPGGRDSKTMELIENQVSRRRRRRKRKKERAE